jgi:hypothetical protein
VRARRKIEHFREMASTIIVEGLPAGASVKYEPTCPPASSNGGEKDWTRVSHKVWQELLSAAGSGPEAYSK